MRSLRQHHGGYFAALVALFLQIFLIAASSAPMPQTQSGSLLADLATICTIDGTKNLATERGHGSIPASPLCNHCSLCHVLKIEPLLSPQALAMLPLAMQTVTYGLSPAILVLADVLKNPTTRGPPSHS